MSGRREEATAPLLAVEPADDLDLKVSRAHVLERLPGHGRRVTLGRCLDHELMAAASAVRIGRTAGVDVEAVPGQSAYLGGLEDRSGYDHELHAPQFRPGALFGCRMRYPRRHRACRFSARFSHRSDRPEGANRHE